jgi:regulatory protein
MEKPYTPQVLSQYTLLLLARREHSQAELKQKLTRRYGVEAIELIKTTLERLAADNYQSDQRFTESYIYSRLQRGFGLNRIKQELQQKGVDRECIGTMLEDAGVKELEQQQVERAWRKKFKALPSTPKEHHQQYYHLTTKGFRRATIEQFFRSRHSDE